MADDDNFLSRWSRRKAQVQAGAVPPAEPVPAEIVAPPLVQPVVEPVAAEPAAAPETPAPPPPTMADVEQLTHASDFSRFVGGGVDGDVRNAALKKLFSDPHFNVMDGLDTYIDDYGKPDPLPASWLRKMTQTHLLGLFSDDEEKAPEASAASPLPDSPPDEDTDLRLQPNDDAGCPGAETGPAEDAGRQR